MFHKVFFEGFKHLVGVIVFGDFFRPVFAAIGEYPVLLVIGNEVVIHLVANNTLDICCPQIQILLRFIE